MRIERMLDLNVRLATQVCVLFLKQQHLRVKSLAFRDGMSGLIQTISAAVAATI